MGGCRRQGDEWVDCRARVTGFGLIGKGREAEQPLWLTCLADYLMGTDDDVGREA
jgi:hypothetical protein